MFLPEPFCHWRFDEAIGSTSAKTVNGDHEISLGGPTFVPARRNNGLQFNPQSGKNLATTDVPELLPPWTAAFWVRREASTGGATLFSSIRFGFKLEQRHDTQKVGLTKYRIYGDTSVPAPFDATFDYSAPLGDWVHLVLVGTDAEIRLYANGELKDTLARSCPLGLRWLGSSGGDVEFASMTLDEVKIFDRALDAAQVAELYGPAIRVTEGANAVTNGGSLQVGTVGIGEPAVSKTFTVTSTGEPALTITGIDIDNTTDYALSPATPTAELELGDTVSFTVTFSPKTAATITAKVTLSVNAPGGSYAFFLTGTGEETKPNVEVRESGRLVSKGATVDFGALRPPATAKRTFTITNTSRIPLRVDNLGLVDPSRFSMSDISLPQELSPGRRISVTVTALSDIKGPASTTLFVQTNARDPSFQCRLTSQTSVPRLVVTDHLTKRTISDGETVAASDNGTGNLFVAFTIADSAGVGIRVSSFQTSTDGAIIYYNGSDIVGRTSPLNVPASGSPVLSVQPRNRSDRRVLQRIQGARISFETNDPDHPTFTFYVDGFFPPSFHGIENGSGPCGPAIDDVR